MAKLPYFPFFPADWLVDTRKLSVAARGAWIDILSYAWNEPTRGTYQREQGMMAQELGLTPDQLKPILAELEWVGVFNIDENGVVTLLSRRMSRDETRREYERKKKRWQRNRGDVHSFSPKSPRVVPQEKSEVRSQKSEVTKVKGKSAHPPKFIKPTALEIATYAKGAGLRMNAQHFFDYYESNGWKVSRNPMRDWKATVRNWCRNEFRTEANHGTNDGKGAVGVADIFKRNRESGRLPGLRKVTPADTRQVLGGVRDHAVDTQELAAAGDQKPVGG